MSHSRHTDSYSKRDIWIECAVILAAASIAAFAARPYAGSWNDGSRLATVESLVDAHTWAIDHSIFVDPSPARDCETPLPYAPAEMQLNKTGTLDKLFIAGHFYSDKSPVPATFLAGCYSVWKWTTGGSARTHADQFCRAMTWASSGMAYVIAVWCFCRLVSRLSIPPAWRLILTGSFALSTVALPYAQQVNNHILLLASASALTLLIAEMHAAVKESRFTRGCPAFLGALSGLSYTIDLGTGPVILLSTALFVLHSCLAQDWRRPALRPCVCFALAALPWLVLHHSLNAAIGGTIGPANANPEYFRWPGSPFAPDNLTGGCVHKDIGSFLLYAASMLAGKRGFMGHNLPLFLAVPAFVLLFRNQREMRPVLLWALGCCAGTWLLYAATSNNSSGQCCTIRWFVPLLAPAYYVLALFLQRFPARRVDFLVLSCWGALLVLLMHEGPWLSHMVRFFWPIQGAALFSWGFCHVRRLRHSCPCELYPTSV